MTRIKITVNGDELYEHSTSNKRSRKDTLLSSNMTGSKVSIRKVEDGIAR